MKRGLESWKLKKLKVESWKWFDFRCTLRRHCSSWWKPKSAWRHKKLPVSKIIDLYYDLMYIFIGFEVEYNLLHSVGLSSCDRGFKVALSTLHV